MIPSAEQKNRELKGRTIAGLKDSVRRIDERLYKVKSQSGNGKEYDVTLTEERGWICSCPDFAYRNEKCKHLFASEMSLKLREMFEGTVTSSSDLSLSSHYLVSSDNCLFASLSCVDLFGFRKLRRLI